MLAAGRRPRVRSGAKRKSNLLIRSGQLSPKRPVMIRGRDVAMAETVFDNPGGRYSRRVRADGDDVCVGIWALSTMNYSP